MATRIDAFKLGVEGHTPEANAARRQAAVARLEQINTLPGPEVGRVPDRAATYLIAQHYGDLYQVFTDDLFQDALADLIRASTTPDLDVAATAENLLIDLEVESYQKSAPQEMADAIAWDAQREQEEERALDYALGAAEATGIARHEAQLRGPSDLEPDMARDEEAGRQQVRDAGFGVELSKEDVVARLGKAYGEGLAQRHANAERMAAIMAGTQLDDGSLSRRQLDVLAEITLAREFFPNDPIWLDSDGARLQYEGAAVNAMEYAMRGIGEWEGLNLAIDHEASQLEFLAQNYAIMYPGEERPRVALLIPDLDGLKEHQAEVHLMLESSQKEVDAAAKVAREYAVHQLRAAAGVPQPAADPVPAPADVLVPPELEQLRELMQQAFPTSLVDVVRSETATAVVSVATPTVNQTQHTQKGRS